MSDRSALAAMVYEAVRFANWAAGEGICPAKGEDAVAPEDFLFDHFKATGNEDWEGLAAMARDAVLLVDLTRDDIEEPRP